MRGWRRRSRCGCSGVAERVEEELGVAGIKFGCDLNGYFGGRPRLPLLPLTRRGAGGDRGADAGDCVTEGLRACDD